MQREQVELLKKNGTLPIAVRERKQNMCYTEHLGDG